MLRPFIALVFGLLFLAGCDPVGPTLGEDGKPTQQIYRLNSFSESRVQFRLLDAVNALRQAGSLTPVELNAPLNAAAATHSRDMAVQNRPWHFGSDGSSPVDRVQRVGYTRRLLGENISETYETELETLAAWMQQPDTRNVIMDPQATELGFGWYQEDNGKIWWTMVVGG